MKTLKIPEITRSAEGFSRSGTSNTTPKQIHTILETPELRATPRNLNYEEVEKRLVTQLREYAEKAGVNCMVIGVSGGVDSGLVSTLAAKAGLRLITVEMPIYQAQDQVDRAQEHINWLKDNFSNVESIRVDLSETFETLKKALPEIENEEVIRYMAYVNTRSRLRGNILYAVANEHNGIVLGTGNKVEDYGIGFFTKFGDGAVDVSPIGELLKSEVRALARHLGVNTAISEAIATDGLHTTGATDEDQIGASYDELEWAMQQVDEFKDITASNYISWKDEATLENFKNNFTGRAKEVIEIYLKRHLGNAHKMEMPPVFTL